MLIKFELSLEDANLVVTALGKLPYESVAGLITKLQAQAAPQLEPPKVDKPEKDK